MHKEVKRSSRGITQNKDMTGLECKNVREIRKLHHDACTNNIKYEQITQHMPVLDAAK